MTVYSRMMLLSEKPEKQGTILDQVQKSSEKILRKVSYNDR